MRVLFVAAATLAVAACTTITPVAIPTVLIPTFPPPATVPQLTLPPIPMATTAAVATATPIAQPPSSATALPQITFSPPATDAPGATSTPAPDEADLFIVAKRLFAWKPEYSDYVHYLIVVELENRGGGWAQVEPFESSFSVYDAAGGVVTTGSFLYAYPDFLAPGDTGYIVEDSVQDGYTVADFSRLEVDGRYNDADGPAVSPLVTSNTNLRNAGFGEGVEATGEVENLGTVPVDSAHAAAIFFDADGDIIGASTTNLIENVDPGKKKAFETIESNPLKVSDVDSYIVIASADAF